MSALGGYTMLGEITMIDATTDTTTLVAAFARDGEVYFLTTTSCTCCASEWDGVTPEALKKAATHDELFDLITAVYREEIGFPPAGGTISAAEVAIRDKIATLLKAARPYFA